MKRDEIAEITRKANSPEADFYATLLALRGEEVVLFFDESLALNTMAVKIDDLDNELRKIYFTPCETGPFKQIEISKIKGVGIIRPVKQRKEQ